MANKFIAIYSVWTDWKWIDPLDKKWTEWIYIYNNSLDDLDKIEEWDIICLIRTSLQKITLFEFTKKEWSYIILPNKENVFEFNNISIWEFKNLYFLNFDNFKSWVRSPLATKKNILIFNKSADILEEYLDIKKIKDVFNNIYNYQRNYIIGNVNNYKDDNKNIYLEYNNNKFIKESSLFSNNNNVLIGKNINEVISLNNNKNINRKLEELLETKKIDLVSYTSYYDLTRVINFEQEISNGLNSLMNQKKEIKEELNKLEKEWSEKNKREIEKLKEVVIDIENNEKQTEKELEDIRKQRLENDDKENNIKMKFKTFNIVIISLWIELFIIFSIFILVWLNILIFKDNELNIFITATLTQMMVVFWIIVKALFTSK